MQSNHQPICIFGISLDRGGAEKLLLNLAILISKERKVFVCLIDEILAYPVPENITIQYLSRTKKTRTSIINTLLIPVYAYRLSRFLKKNNIDTVVSFLERPNYISNFTKLFHKKLKTINSIHTFLSKYYIKNTLHGKMGRVLAKVFYPSADAIVVCSKNMRYDLIKRFRIKSEKIYTIYNAIDIDKIAVPNIDKDKRFTFIHIGSFYEVKNHKMLLQAFSLLPNKQDYRLILVGKGYLENQIRDLVKEMKLESYVQFIHGYENDIYKYLNIADCFTLTSLYEGFPVVLLEALHFNIPIIATDCQSGPREIIAPETPFFKELKDEWELTPYGILSPIQNPQVFAQAMQYISTHKEQWQQMKTNTIKRSKELSLEVYKDKYFKLIEKVEHIAIH